LFNLLFNQANLMSNQLIKSPTLKAVLKTWAKPNADDEYSVFFRVTKNRKTNYVSLGIKCKEEYWNKEKGRANEKHPNQAALNIIITTKKLEYEKLGLNSINDENDLQASEMKQGIENEFTNDTFLTFVQSKIEQFKAGGKIGNAGIYKDLKNSMSEFKGLKKIVELKFGGINYTFLLDYETHLLKNGHAKSGISIKMRTLRALYNDAIKQSIISSSKYPFKQYSISSRLKSEANRRAIPREQIYALKEIEFDHKTTIFQSQQYFLFSYYSFGMSFVDMANLKWENIQGNKITYVRQKTGGRINVPISPNLLNILNLWMPKTGKELHNYVLPILDRTKHITPTQKDDRVNKIIKRVNKELKIIGAIAGIETPLTTYVARHSMAMALKSAGQPTSVISEVMGHQTQLTTNHYLKSLDDSIFIDAADTL
jgi:integrase/recombinase XerD